MSRDSSGTYTAPSNSFNPAVEGTDIDENDWNDTLDDLVSALTDSLDRTGKGSVSAHIEFDEVTTPSTPASNKGRLYVKDVAGTTSLYFIDSAGTETSLMSGSGDVTAASVFGTDNVVVRSDGTGKGVQATGISIDDSNNVTGAASITATSFNVGNADTTITRTGAGDIAVEGNAMYRAGGTDVALADGGTGASLTDPAADRIMAWDDSAGSVKFTALADFNVEASPATGDYLLAYTAEGALVAINWSSLPGVGSGISELVQDTTPQLGGQLDVNGHALGDGTLELLSFTETASAVNQVNITNAATGNGPIVGAAGDDTNVDLRLTAKGSGVVNVTSTLKADGTIELGHASDTTLSRVSAGLIAVEGNTVCLLGTAQEFTRTHNFDMTTLTDGASVSWDLSQNQVAQLTLGGNRTLSAPTNQVAGATYILIVKQDGTGSRTLSWDATYKFPGGVDPTLSTAASAIDVVTFVSDGSNMLGVCQKAFA